MLKHGNIKHGKTKDTERLLLSIKLQILMSVRDTVDRCAHRMQSVRTQRGHSDVAATLDLRPREKAAPVEVGVNSLYDGLPLTEFRNLIRFSATF